MRLNEEYKAAIKFAREHYENFPVVSLFLPDDIQKHVAIIYKFARIADDIADNDDGSPEARMKELVRFETNLVKAIAGKNVDSFWEALLNTIAAYKLTTKYFFDLIEAFKLDIENKGFETFKDVLNYCAKSANPVGRIMLELFDIRHEEAMTFSDKITTALQLINFYQDVRDDLKKGRVYFPEDELRKFNLEKNKLLNLSMEQNFRDLLEFSLNRAEVLLNEGRSLLKFLPPMFKIQIKLTILGGKTIINKIRKNNYDTVNIRPKINKLDATLIFVKSFFYA